MKNLQEQAIELIQSDALKFSKGELSVYIRRYFGEKSFRLSLESGVPVPNEALYEMSKNPSFEKDQIEQNWWIEGDDEFLIGQHVIECAEKAATEIQMVGARFRCEVFSVVNSIRYWNLYASYQDFEGSCPVFDVNGVRYFLMNIKSAYSAESASQAQG